MVAKIVAKSNTVEDKFLNAFWAGGDGGYWSSGASRRVVSIGSGTGD